MDPVVLVLNALASGAAQGPADGVSDAVKSAYTKLEQLVSAKFSGDKSAEMVLTQHGTDPETWQVPLAKALTTSGAGRDLAIVEVAQQLMALLDQVGTEQGRYLVDLRGAQGAQIGDGNQQFNTFNSIAPTLVMSPPEPEIRPGQPRNEAAFGEAFKAAGGQARLGRALNEAYEDGPGWVQDFDGGTNGRPAVICALFGQSAVAVDREVWNALGRFGRGTYVSGTAAVGFPVAPAEHSLITDEGGSIELFGGAWGRGRLLLLASGDWGWQPEIVFDSAAHLDRDTGFRHGEMDLRLRVAARIPLIADELRVTEAGRAQMLAALSATGLTDLIGVLVRRYGLDSANLAWEETPESEGRNNSQHANYQLVVPGANGHPALLGSLSFMLPGGRDTTVRAIADLGIDFAAIDPDTGDATPPQIAPDLSITPSELVSFFTSAWQAATDLVVTTGTPAVEVPPAGTPRLELYIQNRRPELSGGPRVLRTLDMTNLSVFGPTRNTHLSDLSVGVRTPLGLSAEKVGSLVRQALIRMANDFGFTAADGAEI